MTDTSIFTETLVDRGQFTSFNFFTFRKNEIRSTIKFSDQVDQKFGV